MSLRQGDRGTAVEALQRALNTRGASLVPDGAFGPRTDAAVKVYQARWGLVVDGIAGPRTLAALGLAPTTQPPPPTLPTGATPTSPGPAAELEVPRVRTPIALPLLARALRQCWRARFESPIDALSLRMALAHLRFEHGTEPGPEGLQLRACFCNNFGNVMIGKAGGTWFSMAAEEIIEGKPEMRRSKWRAYPDPIAGADGYLVTMRRSFPRMLAAFASGDPAHVAAEGKAEGYFTASVMVYAARLAGVYVLTTVPAEG